MIIREAIGVGSTVDDARENAIEKLGARADEDIKFDVVSIPKKKVLGIFGGSEAEVRAYIEGSDVPEVKKSVRTEKPKPEKTAVPKNDRKPVSKPAVQPKKPAERPAVEETKVVEAEEKPGVPAEQLNHDSQSYKAYAYLKGILEKLGCADIAATVSDVEGGSKITLEGSDKLGVIIGHRGETLDALQYLSSLVANERSSGYYRVVIDIGNYREKREATLKALARRTASQVLRTGRSRSLEPMNPYERRVIHTAVQNIEGVSSASIGDGSGRRVVISLEGKPARPFTGGRGGRGPRQNSGRTATRPAVNTEDEAVKKPKENDGTKLYGRIDK